MKIQHHKIPVALAFNLQKPDGMNDSKEIGIPDRRQSLIREILQYLIAHPDAKDTQDGIQSWWLPSHPKEWEPAEVQEVLDHFVSKGWLHKRNLPLFRNLYSLNNERLEEIKAYLQTLGSKTVCLFLIIS